MKAVVSITLDNEFVVHDIKVIDGDKGLFIAMPSRKTGEGEYRDIAHPINPETRNKIQETILEHYEKALEEENLEDCEQQSSFFYVLFHFVLVKKKGLVYDIKRKEKESKKI